MMKIAVALLVLVAVAAAMPSDQFEIFERKYNKKYASVEERQHRMRVFTQTLARIEKLNQGEPFRPHGVNEFADMTQEEFSAKYLMDPVLFAAKREERLANTPLLDLSTVDNSIPATWNWATNSSVVTPVKNQGQCGSCWAFSATENIESVWALAGNPIVSLAPQQIVDCDTTDDGCNGGDTPTAYEYVIKAGGLEPENDYPYVAKNTKCTFSASKVAAKISGYSYATKTKNETEMQVATANVAPLSICVDAITWQTYTGGIITKNCGTSLDHCVQITGWGVQSDTTYWIVRNSWGTSWGEKGFIYVELGKDLCGIATEATTSSV